MTNRCRSPSSSRNRRSAGDPALQVTARTGTSLYRVGQSPNTEPVKPNAVKVAVVVALVIGLTGLISAGVVLAHAGHNADLFVRGHPGRSRSLGLAGSYILAGGVALISCLEFFGAWSLHKGRRSGWVLLLGLAGLGVLGVFTTRSFLGILSLVPDVVLLVCLLMPSTRAQFQKRPQPAL